MKWVVVRSFAISISIISTAPKVPPKQQCAAQLLKTEGRCRSQAGKRCLVACSFRSSMQDDLSVTFLASTSVVDFKPSLPPYNLRRFIALLQVACRPLITGASMQRVLEPPEASPLSPLKTRFPRFAALRNGGPSSHPRFQRPTVELPRSQPTLLAQAFATCKCPENKVNFQEFSEDYRLNSPIQALCYTPRAVFCELHP